MGEISGDHIHYDCGICAEPCKDFGVFECGHYVCGVCALRIHTINKGGCPICRKESSSLVVTDSKFPRDDNVFDTTVFNQRTLARQGGGKRNGKSSSKNLLFCKSLNAYMDGTEVYDRMSKLNAFVCPVPGCWDHGHQEPFKSLKDLQLHLKTAHGLRYCTICLQNRPVFLCEQITYTDKEMEQHHRGKCKKDSPVFQGHPLDLFSSRRFYDGEALLKHMMKQYYTCDVCNASEFVFTFYKTRDKLLEHFAADHKLCTHPDCAHLDPMERVFRSEVELQLHMQKAHGTQSRNLDPNSLGFNFSAAPAATPGGIPPAAPAHGVATGITTHTVTITFDHVISRQTLDLMPTNSRKEGTHHAFNLPSHFLAVQPLPLVHPAPPVAVADASSSSTAAATTAPDGSDAAQLPTDPKLLDKILKDRLAACLSPQRVNELKQYSMDYLNGVLLATEFYQRLQRHLPDADALESVFKPLVMSIPNERKREALVAARRMLTSREAAVLERQRREREAVVVKMPWDDHNEAVVAQPTQDVEGDDSDDEGDEEEKEDAMAEADNVEKNAWGMPVPTAAAPSTPTSALCGKVLACGHTCPHPQHDGDCPRCVVKVQITCSCGVRKNTIPCHQYQKRLADSTSKSVSLECTDDCAYKNRLSALAGLGGGSKSANKAKVIYSIKAWEWAKQNLAAVKAIEKELMSFIQSNAHSIALRHMPPEKRMMVHELCNVYFINCESVDREPVRSCVLTRHGMTAVPSPLLSDAILDPKNDPGVFSANILSDEEKAAERVIQMCGAHLQDFLIPTILRPHCGNFVIVPEGDGERTPQSYVFNCVFTTRAEATRAFSYLRRQSPQAVSYRMYSGEGGFGKTIASNKTQSVATRDTAGGWGAIIRQKPTPKKYTTAPTLTTSNKFASLNRF